MTVAFSGLVPSMGPAHCPPDLHTLTSSFFSKVWLGTCFLPGAVPGKEMEQKASHVIPHSGPRVGGRQTTVARQVGAGTGIHSQEDVWLHGGHPTLWTQEAGQASWRRQQLTQAQKAEEMLAPQRPGSEAVLGRRGDGPGRESSVCTDPGVKEGVACVRRTLSGVMEVGTSSRASRRSREGS